MYAIPGGWRGFLSRRHSRMSSAAMPRDSLGGGPSMVGAKTLHLCRREVDGADVSSDAQRGDDAASQAAAQAGYVINAEGAN